MPRVRLAGHTQFAAAREAARSAKPEPSSPAGGSVRALCGAKALERRKTLAAPLSPNFTAQYWGTLRRRRVFWPSRCRTVHRLRFGSARGLFGCKPRRRMRAAPQPSTRSASAASRSGTFPGMTRPRHQRTTAMAAAFEGEANAPPVAAPEERRSARPRRPQASASANSSRSSRARSRA